MTIVQQNISVNEDDNFYSCVGEIDPTNIQIPIVGYEIMEERARFTVCFCLYIIQCAKEVNRTDKISYFFCHFDFRYLNFELNIKHQAIVGMFSEDIQTL